MVELPKTFVLLDLIRVLAWFVHAQSCPDTPHWWFVSKWSLAWSIRPSVSYPLPLHPIAMEHNPGATVRGLYGEYSFLSRILSLPSGIVCQFIVYTYLGFSDSCLLSWTWDFRLMPTLPNLRFSSAYRTTLAHDCRNLMGRNKLFCIGNTRYQSPQNRNTCTKLTIIKIITTLGWRTRALDLWYSHGHILALPYQNKKII